MVKSSGRCHDGHQHRQRNEACRPVHSLNHDDGEADHERTPTRSPTESDNGVQRKPSTDDPWESDRKSQQRCNDRSGDEDNPGNSFQWSIWQFIESPNGTHSGRRGPPILAQICKGDLVLDGAAWQLQELPAEEAAGAKLKG